MSDVLFANWQAPPKDYGIRGNEAHVWLVSLSLPASSVEKYWSVLSCDEQNRAKWYHFVKDRDRFIVAHGVLRTVLGRYVMIGSKDLNFTQNAFGKLYLTNETGGDFLSFNLSHSRDLALIAIASKREVGVDIEWLRDDFATEQIAARFFSQRENEELFSLEKSLQKKAYIKARGEGLSIPLHQFDVSLTPGKPAKLVCSRERAAEVAQWSMHDLDSIDQYAAAVVIEGHGCKIKCWQWLEEPNSLESTVVMKGVMRTSRSRPIKSLNF